MFKVGDVRFKTVLLSGEKVDEVWFVPWKPYLLASGKGVNSLALQMWSLDNWKARSYIRKLLL
jgi:hypothetical protein